MLVIQEALLVLEPNYAGQFSNMYRLIVCFRFLGISWAFFLAVYLRTPTQIHLKKLYFFIKCFVLIKKPTLIYLTPKWNKVYIKAYTYQVSALYIERKQLYTQIKSSHTVWSNGGAIQDIVLRQNSMRCKMNMHKNFKEKIGMIVFSTNSNPEINSQANL